jgi:hypothetical protein
VWDVASHKPVGEPILGSHERTLLSLNSLLTGEKTGIFMNLGNDFWIYNRVNAAFVVGYGPGSDFLFCPRQGIFSCLSGN